MAERIVELQDLSDPEVMLEVEVLEVQRSRLQELGIRLPDQLTLSPLSNGTTPLTLEQLGSLNRSTIQASVGNVVINAHEDDQQSNILANPRIRVRNKEKAKIMIGDRLPVFTTNSTTTGFVSESISYIDVGLKLEVEPNIYLDDEVAIKVNLEVSTLVNQIISKSGSLAYQIGTRGANTLLRLKDGETQVLAGLISDQDRSTANRVPGLGELPILGRLFGSQQDNTQRSEILLSITPRVVRAIHRTDLQSAEFESGTETSIGSHSLRLATLEVAPRLATNVTVPTNIVSTAVTPAITPTVLPTGVTGVTATQKSSEIPASTSNTANTTNDTSLIQASVNSQATKAALSMQWQTPAQVKVGEQFSALLQIYSEEPLRSLPLLVAFDTKVLQIVSVEEGDFFKHGDGQYKFNYRVDPVQGKIFIANIHKETAGGEGDTESKGTGSLFKLTFKTLKAETNTKVQLLSATPEPPASVPVAMPIEQIVQVLK
jgi:general secretion pathway protein D